MFLIAAEQLECIAILNINNIKDLYGNNIKENSTTKYVYSPDEYLPESPSGSRPSTFSLFQNYPNPFNPETSIAFHLAKAGQTTVTVYNALGQIVTQLVNDVLPAGSHQAIFHVDNLQSGVYYYKIQSGDFSDMKKMLLLNLTPHCLNPST